MTAPHDIALLKKELKDLLSNKSMGEVLLEIKLRLPAHSSKQNQLLALQTRLNRVNRQQQAGMLSFDEQGREYAKITNALIALIDAIELSDFESKGNAKSDRKRKRGSILYRIPNLMQLNEETKCIVRLAFLEEIIKENIEITDDTRIQSIRISEVMSVELLDRSQQGAFAITTHNQAEQFLDEYDYSEWLFYVKPLLEGVFPLVLKVSVIEEVRGKERVREIVLEESIQIVTGAPVQDAVFQTADYEISKVSNERSVTEIGSSDVDFQTVIKSVEAENPTPIPAAPSNKRSLNPIRRYATVLAFLLVAAVGAWAVDVPRELDWQYAKFKDTPEAYEEFIEDYETKGEKRIEKAYFKKAETANEIEDYQEYLDKYEEAERVEVIEELYFDKVLEVVSVTQKIDPITDFIVRYNRSKIPAARELAKKKVLEVAQTTEDSEGLQTFLQKVVKATPPPAPEEEIVEEEIPDEVFEQEVEEKIVEIKTKKVAVAAAEQGNTALLEEFVEKYPNSERVKTARMKLKEISTAKTDEVQEGVKGEEKVTDAKELEVESKEVVRTPQQTHKTEIAKEKIEPKQTPTEEKSITEITKTPVEENPVTKNSAIPIPEMVFVKGGTYWMGCKEGRDENCKESEKPAHEVQLKDFYIGKYEVTNQQYAFFLNDYGSDKVKNGEYESQVMIEADKWGVQKTDGQWQAAKGYETHPVVYVSWYGAIEYAKWLSKQTGKNFRLPSEAEWEYAARGGQNKQGFTYSGSDDINKVAWYDSNSNSTNKIGAKNANGLGLYDMSGNVYEWCMDCWNATYEGAPTNNLAWTKGGCTRRVVRGGSWDNGTTNCRVANRNRLNADYRFDNVGFRVARY